MNKELVLNKESKKGNLGKKILTRGEEELLLLDM